MSKHSTFLKESIEEMRSRVTWPKYATLQNSAVVVLIASLLFAMLIGLVDLCFKNAVAWLYEAL